MQRACRQLLGRLWVRLIRTLRDSQVLISSNRLEFPVQLASESLGLLGVGVSVI